MDIVFHRQMRPEAGTFDISPAIRCARKWNPHSRVVLIGDEHQPKDLCEFLSVEEYSESMDKLRGVFRYPHQSEKWFSWVTLCQWLTLADYCRKHNVDRVFAPDTDVLTFCDIDEAAKPFLKNDFTISAPLGSPQCPMFIFNHQVLEDFVAYLVALYSSEKAADTALINEGLDSMRLWDFFWRTTHYSRGDTSVIEYPALRSVEGSVFDHNIAQDDGRFEHDGTAKVITWIKGRPYCQCGNQLVRFNSLHMWAGHKKRMGEFMKLSEDSL